MTKDLVVKHDYSYLQPKHQYTDGVAEAILTKLESGMLLRQVCAIAGFPKYHDVCKWMRVHPEFKGAVQAILGDKLRSLVEADIAMLERGPEELTREEAAGHKNYNDKMKFYLERVLKEDYSPTHKHEVSGEVVTRIVVETGIERDPARIREIYGLSDKELPIEVESEVIKEEDGEESIDDVLSEETPGGNT